MVLGVPEKKDHQRSGASGHGNRRAGPRKQKGSAKILHGKCAQRLGIAQAIMEDPAVILLDEPMNGLDNQGVEDIRKVLLSLRDKGKTILLASHSKEDIAVLCDTVTEMEAGHAKRVDGK